MLLGGTGGLLLGLSGGGGAKRVGGVWLNERGRGLGGTGRGLNEGWGLMGRCWVLLGGTGGHWGVTAGLVRRGRS